MKTMVVDFVIVYLSRKIYQFTEQLYGRIIIRKITYNETVTNSNPQFEKPMSMPLARPDGDIAFSDVLQSMWMRDIPVVRRYKTRITQDRENLNTKWQLTISSG